MFPVARADPELAVVDVGGDHFLVASLTILTADELNQGVVDVGSLGKEEAAARAELVEEEQLLLLVVCVMVRMGVRNRGGGKWGWGRWEEERGWE